MFVYALRIVSKALEKYYHYYDYKPNVKKKWEGVRKKHEKVKRKA